MLYNSQELGFELEINYETLLFNKTKCLGQVSNKENGGLNFLWQNSVDLQLYLQDKLYSLLLSKVLHSNTDLILPQNLKHLKWSLWNYMKTTKRPRKFLSLFLLLKEFLKILTQQEPKASPGAFIPMLLQLLCNHKNWLISCLCISSRS